MALPEAELSDPTLGMRRLKPLLQELVLPRPASRVLRPPHPPRGTCFRWRGCHMLLVSGPGPVQWPGSRGASTPLCLDCAVYVLHCGLAALFAG